MSLLRIGKGSMSFRFKGKKLPAMKPKKPKVKIPIFGKSMAFAEKYLESGFEIEFGCTEMLVHGTWTYSGNLTEIWRGLIIL
jgi:hypothetical protein